MLGGGGGGGANVGRVRVTGAGAIVLCSQFTDARLGQSRGRGPLFQLVSRD